ncbi:AzlD family protein [Thalassococcus sp. BH17M4-6]|uniref:AzlD family protein n=1 Tax=Thalassococcus sp. BH17M4-6 TaxID=3413148 RepID=UPI003BC83615
MIDPHTFYIILVMSGVVLLTRLAGPEIMRMIGINARMEKALSTMASAVIVAILANEVADGGWRDAIAIGVTAAALLILRNEMAAMLTAVAVAAAGSFLAL